MICGVPIHVPGVVANVSPARAVPERLGSTVLIGGETTGAEFQERWEVVPSALLAVTRMWTRAPTSAVSSTYASVVAPGMSTQLFPSTSHLRHWYANVIGVAPVQTPCVPVSVCPYRAFPEIAGRSVLTGGLPTAIADGVQSSTASSAAMARNQCGCDSTNAVRLGEGVANGGSG